MNVEVDDIRTKEADDRGRLYLGTEYANKRITVAIVEVAEDQPNEDELAAAYRNAAESAREITREFEQVSDEAWESLGPAPGVEGYDADGGNDE
ncbi:hypothetical protein [Halocatena halophila]|uniref:hypothetical protein n=1 Tax=Halocatena halophila TaxID=2814576 RepID=UPI002ED37BC5